MDDRLVEPKIEDILGSIRRLTAEVPARPSPPLGRLILTQAQRVHPMRGVRDTEGGVMTTFRADPPPPLTVSGEVHDRLAPIDEEVLQEIVRELLTEELQGPLGEKITRNIRKMVRAEIGRALSEQDISARRLK